MRNRRVLVLLGVAIVSVIALSNVLLRYVVPSEWINSDNIALGETLAVNETVNDDLVLVGNQLDLQADAVVQGDAALVGAAITVMGQVEGDLTVLGESVTLDSSAHIRGDALFLVSEAVIAGQVDGELNIRSEQITILEDARIDGLIYACGGSITDNRINPAGLGNCNDSELTSLLEPLQSISGLNQEWLAFEFVKAIFSLLVTLGLSGLAVLAVVIFPRQISHIEEAVSANPQRVGLTGFMVILLLVGISFAFAVLLAAAPLLGMIVLPVYLLIALIFLGMALSGWITMSLVVGDLLTSRVIKTPLPPLIIAVVGNIVLVLISNVLLLNPIGQALGLIVMLGVVSAGLGGTLITRLGTRPIHRSYLVQG